MAGEIALTVVRLNRLLRSTDGRNNLQHTICTDNGPRRRAMESAGSYTVLVSVTRGNSDWLYIPCKGEFVQPANSNTCLTHIFGPHRRAMRSAGCYTTYTDGLRD